MSVRMTSSFEFSGAPPPSNRRAGNYVGGFVGLAKSSVSVTEGSVSSKAELWHARCFRRALGVRSAARRGGRGGVPPRAGVFQRGGELPEVRSDLGRRSAEGAAKVHAGCDPALCAMTLAAEDLAMRRGRHPW